MPPPPGSLSLMGRKEMDMAGRQNKGEKGSDLKPGELVKFKFSKMWSSDRGVFQPGAEAELPEDIAESLMAEGMGDLA